MELDRKRFLKLAGLGAMALAVTPAYKLATRLGQPEQLPPLPPPPVTGKRFAMVVDTRLCKSGCTDCMDICRSIHNVPVFPNPKDQISWIWQLPFADAFPDMPEQSVQGDLRNGQVMALCNHCDNPPCVRVCPTGATFRRPDGIVDMDYHRCIGCRYCMAACPYGARSFNWRDPRPFIKEINLDFPTRTRGVVEKCNLCDERLAKGQLPACVEQCKEKALIFGDLEDPQSQIRAILQANFSIQRKPGLGTKPQVYYIV